MGDVTSLRVNFDSVTAERVAITQCATFVRRRIAEMQAAEAWIACGKELASLKSKLVRKTPRGENERIGWNQAFVLEPREFPFGRRHADKLIDIYAFFQLGHAWPIKKLPAAMAALHLLVTSKFSIEQIAQGVADGLISPGSTEHEIKAVAKKLKLLRSAKRPSRQACITRIKKLMQKFEITIEELQGG